MMRGIYETMQSLRATKRDIALSGVLPRAELSQVRAQPESLYAALLSQVHRRDTLLTQGNDRLLHAAVSACFPKAGNGPKAHVLPGNPDECAGIAVGMALQQIAAARKAGRACPVVIALLRGFPPMAGVLQLIEQHQMPVLLVAQGEPESRTEAQRRLSRTKVPVMPVDASDAVAVCRVVQECMLRARNGWGGAVLHAFHLPDAGDPLVTFRKHLRNPA